MGYGTWDTRNRLGVWSLQIILFSVAFSPACGRGSQSEHMSKLWRNDNLLWYVFWDSKVGTQPVANYLQWLSSIHQVHFFFKLRFCFRYNIQKPILLLIMYFISDYIKKGRWETVWQHKGISLTAFYCSCWTGERWLVRLKTRMQYLITLQLIIGYSSGSVVFRLSMKLLLGKLLKSTVRPLQYDYLWVYDD